MKKVKVILSKEAKEVFEYLNEKAVNSKEERSILNSVKQKSELIKANPHYGNPVSKKLTPKEFIKKYNVKNLFRVELPNFWRMFYTLTEGETKIEIISFVLEICDHKKYNKLFGYKGR